MKVSFLLSLLAACLQTQAQTASSYSSAASSSRTASASSASSSSTASAIPTIQVNARPAGALNATAWALIYAYPLYIFGNFAGNVLRNVGVNEIFHQTQLASVDSPGVIKPNVDTVYSRVVLDLSRSDLILTVPNVTDRYYVYPVIDSFGNIIAEIGVVNGNKPGKYLIRRADDVLVPAGLQNVTDYRLDNSLPSNSSAYAGIINLPTTHGTMLIRFLVKQNTTADLDIIHRYQNASSLTPIHRNVTLGATPPGNLSSLAPNGTLLGISSVEKLLNFTAKFAPYNQPENYTERARVAGILGAAGIYDGTWTPQTSVNLTFASAIANASYLADIQNSANIRPQGNDWQLSIPSYQGNYGRNYAPRAYVAISGYQAQTVNQTLYPGYKNIGFTSQFNLAINTSLLLTFSGKPQLKSYGFWSFTIYGPDQYLIPNPLNRFEVGDRTTSLVYQGSRDLIYGPNATARDGTFQVLVQPVSQVPPANWTSNWLPSSQNFSAIVRWYTPQDAMINGSYVYPKIETVPSILA